tara:strand:- start:2478 stop:3521 length:1044 start_codon:yes stop_codon:yes gene_type:complete
MARTMSGIDVGASSGGDGDVTQAGTNVFTGTNTYNTNRPTSTIAGGVGLAGDDFITKDDFDTLTSVSDVTQAGTNVFTGTNQYNTNRPTSTIAGGVGLAGDDFITKDDFDTLTNVSDVTQAGTNNFTGTNTFNSSRPSSTLSYPSNSASDNDFITKKDFNEDLRDGMIVQTAIKYYRGFIKSTSSGGSTTPKLLPTQLGVSFTPISSNSHVKVSFLIHYGAPPSSFNNWAWNSITIRNYQGFVVADSNTDADQTVTNANATAGNTMGDVTSNSAFRCAPITNTFIDENPDIDVGGTGKITYVVAVRPYGAQGGLDNNDFTINTVYQEADNRPKYCSFIMAEEIFKKA